MASESGVTADSERVAEADPLAGFARAASSARDVATYVHPPDVAARASGHMKWAIGPVALLLVVIAVVRSGATVERDRDRGIACTFRAHLMHFLLSNVVKH